MNRRTKESLGLVIGIVFIMGFMALVSTLLFGCTAESRISGVALARKLASAACKVEPILEYAASIDGEVVTSTVVGLEVVVTSTDGEVVRIPLED